MLMLLRGGAAAVCFALQRRRAGSNAGQLLTVALSSNETSDKSASDLVLFPLANTLPFQFVL